MLHTKKKLFFTQTNNESKTEEQILQRKKESRQNAKQWVANEEPSSMKTSVKEIAKIGGNTTSYSMNGIQANARTRVDQDVDLVLKNMKPKTVGQPQDEVLMTTDSQYKHYKITRQMRIA